MVHWLPRALLLIGGSGIAPAGWAKDLPTLDASSEVTLLESAAELGFGGWGKVKGEAPRAIAITSFRVRFDLRTESTTSQSLDLETFTTSQKFLELPDEAYQAMTDAMYQQIADRFVAAGFEVLPGETVTGDPTWQSVKGEEGSKTNDRRVLFVPTGYKQFPITANPAKIARPAWENGAASVRIDVVLGLCDLKGNEKKGVGGVRVCVKAPGMPFSDPEVGFDLQAQGPTASNDRAAWTVGVRKSLIEIDPAKYGMVANAIYQTGSFASKKSVMDLPLVHDAAVMPQTGGSWWSGPEYDASATEFAAAVEALFGMVSDVAVAHYAHLTAGDKWSAGSGSYT